LLYNIINVKTQFIGFTVGTMRSDYQSNLLHKTVLLTSFNLLFFTAGYILVLTTFHKLVSNTTCIKTHASS